MARARKQPEPRVPAESRVRRGYRADSLEFPSLHAAPTAEDYLLHLAALEWSLDAPIVIREEADIQSKRRWQTRVQPYAHQVDNLITFCRRSPVALIADDVGLGKTISAGLIMAELMERRKVVRTLVVAPKLLLPQWVEELQAKFDIAGVHASGSETNPYLQGRHEVVVTTYHTVRDHGKAIERAEFDMLVLDEAHKCRNLYPSANPPKFAGEIRRLLAERRFRYVLMLTATPIQNRLWDLYSLVDLLTVAKGHENPLGSPEAFRGKFIADAKGVVVQPRQREAFRRSIGNYIVRTRRADARLLFPTRTVRTVKVPQSRAEAELSALVGDLFRSEGVNGLEQSSIGQALMSSPIALVDQLRNRERKHGKGAAIADRAEQILERAGPSSKLAGLVKLIDELAEQRPSDWRVVVFTSRRKTLEMVRDELRRRGYPVGCISGADSGGIAGSLAAFRQDPPEVRVIVSTDTGAEGVNLQAANVLVNFDLPWNPMVLEQRIGRIQRLASRHAEVHVLNLVLARSVEEKVVAKLAEKLQAIAQSLGDLEAILETTGGSDEGSASFESVVRDLVLNSLKGIDEKEALRLALESIDRAKHTYEEEQATVERTLGELDQMRRTGPRAPDIEPLVPSMPAREFVMAALVRDGARFRALDGDTLGVSLPGTPDFRLTFKERSLDGDLPFDRNPPRVYVPGKRDFERLAQSWLDRAGAFVVDRSSLGEKEAFRAVKEWMVGREGMSLRDVVLEQNSRRFCGELTFRSSAAVRHDRIENVVRVQVGKEKEELVDSILAAGTPSVIQFDGRRHCDGIEDALRDAIDRDPNITKFCQFYEQRLDEELAMAADRAAEVRIREDFEPVKGARLAGARGVLLAEITVQASIAIDGEGPYSTRFELLPEGGGGCVVQPAVPWSRCATSGREVPEEALYRCDVSGDRVLKHLLDRSQASGRLAKPELLVKAADSGRLLLPDETRKSSVSGLPLDVETAASSEASGRVASESELIACEVTGALVLPDELLISQISGKRFRSDELARSDVSGRVGHRSEFVEVVDPHGLAALDEVARSDVSGAIAARASLVTSELAPGRLGLKSESALSSISGGLYLLDELQRCAVSGELALPSELEKCEFSGVAARPDKLACSEVSGRRYRVDERLASVLSGRTGHFDEFRDSVLPPGPLAVDEVGTSDVSGRHAALSLMTKSAKPPFRKGLPDEVGVSEVSGKEYLLDELERSDLTGKFALPDELVRCEFSNSKVLPSEVRRSDVSGRFYREDRGQRSAVSGRCGHVSEFVASTWPSGFVASDEAAQSSMSGRWGSAAALRPSAKPPHRFGFPDEVATCEVTGRLLLRDELGLSEVSGRLVDLDLLVRSSASGRAGLSDELATCEASGAKLLPEEVDRCSVTGKMVDRRMLTASDESGESALAHCLVTCAASRKRVLPSESLKCAATGQRVAGSLTTVCVVTGRRALTSRMATSPLTGRRYIADDTTLAEIQGRFGPGPAVRASAWSNRRGLAMELARCSLSGLWFAPDELNAAGELEVLRFLLDGAATTGAAPGSSAWVESVRRLSPRLKSAVETHSVATPDGLREFGVARCKSGFLGLSSAHVGYGVEVASLSLLFEPVVGRRDGGRWSRG